MAIKKVGQGGAGRVSGKAQQVDKVGIGAGQAAQAGAAAGAEQVAGVDVPKVAQDIAQTLGSAADKFTMLAGVNPFSAQAGKLMDILTEGHKTIMDALKDWGESQRKIAEQDRKASEREQRLETHHRKPRREENQVKDSLTGKVGGIDGDSGTFF